MHTQGALKVIEADEYCGPYLTDEIGETVADLYYMYRPNTPHRFANCEANARRLVACWNACEGIETEALESGLLRQILVELKRQSDAARGEVTANRGTHDLASCADRSSRKFSSSYSHLDSQEQRDKFEAAMRAQDPSVVILWENGEPDSFSQLSKWKLWLACLAANQSTSGEVTA